VTVIQYIRSGEKYVLTAALGMVLAVVVSAIAASLGIRITLDLLAVTEVRLSLLLLVVVLYFVVLGVPRYAENFLALYLTDPSDARRFVYDESRRVVSEVEYVRSMLQTVKKDVEEIRWALSKGPEKDWLAFEISGPMLAEFDQHTKYLQEMREILDRFSRNLEQTYYSPERMELLRRLSELLEISSRQIEVLRVELKMSSFRPR